MTSSQQPDISRVESYFRDLQDRISQQFETIEKTPFHEDTWQRDAGGGGRTRVVENGHVIEKGGVNFSLVYGDQLPPSATASRPELAGRSFKAMGVSLVIHPRNPKAPTSHANVRFFVAEKQGEPAVWWFGGGYDLTPYYGYAEDCQHWHSVAKQACAPFGDTLYSDYKRWCDRYFYLKHRDEPRGIGGIFFDDLNSLGFEQSFSFVRSVGDSYLDAYMPILQRRIHEPYDDQHRRFQAYRRGRYVEFNLVYDRGTIFGLQSGGRTESILMSMPPHVEWKYDWQPDPGTEEARLYSEFLTDKDWIELD